MTHELPYSKQVYDIGAYEPDELVIETAEGSIVSFDNGVDDLPMKSLVVNINYRQSGWDSIKVYTSGKNLLWNMQGESYKTSGITYTKTADGKVIANGTATGNAWYKLVNGEFICKAPMVLSGCPSGGSASTYEIQLDGVANVHDFGSGVSFNTSGSGRFYIVVRSGQTVDNLVFEPMVRLATDSDPTYEPYQGQTISKTLGQTVYGGTLDLISGVLTSTLNADGTQKPTPEVIQLTPELIETLDGVNNIWADSGDIKVAYIPAVEKNILPYSGEKYYVGVFEPIDEDNVIVDSPVTIAPIDEPINITPIDEPIALTEKDEPIDITPIDEPIALTETEENDDGIY